ncbi:survival factor 1 [Rhizodiscina lignyota]|uniref:Survival factor 1 n=1 Tax=Rhizodiscina lignyota TaxID=1504668 RepID=A0A9P4IQK4_9PEZI|nr:survival factor 1 [Rhizodiscina lignyota]
MFQWAQQTLANVAGTQEPHYGPEAIQSVEAQAKDTPYTELTKDDLKWRQLNYTNVETQTFYVFTNDGKIAMAQVIYSNVMSLNVTVQFCSKVFYQDGKTPNLFSSNPLHNHTASEDKFSFLADKCSVELSEDGSAYHIQSSTSDKCLVDVTFTRTTPGFKVGKDGTSYFGTDHANPWGHMYHGFWPACTVTGRYRTEGGDLDMSGKGVYIHAIQGMKPHHAAARWNFANFKSPSYNAIMMEFTTPASYGTTVVNVGGITTQDTILFAGAPQKAEHTETSQDAENEWPAPTAGRYTWHGTTKDGKEVTAELAAPLGDRLDRIDVMAEVPKFVKQIVAGAAGTKPYIYQYGLKTKLKIKIGDEEKEEDGQLFTEATFIS